MSPFRRGAAGIEVASWHHGMNNEIIRRVYNDYPWKPGIQPDKSI
jgi:hypothetical protein